MPLFDQRKRKLISHIELEPRIPYRSIAIPEAADVAVVVAAAVSAMVVAVVVMAVVGVVVIAAVYAVLFASALPAPVRQKRFHCLEQGPEPEAAAVTFQIPVTNAHRASAAAVDMDRASAEGMNYIRPPSGEWAFDFPRWEGQRVSRRLKCLTSSAFSVCPAYFAD